MFNCRFRLTKSGRAMCGRLRLVTGSLAHIDYMDHTGAMVRGFFRFDLVEAL